MRSLAMVVALTLLLPGCEPALPRRPSILLVVLDTTRVDAVSAYGAVVGTTPRTDALAADGLRFTRAYATAPWTLPSHATLFTGTLPAEHGVTWRRTRAPSALETVAERLRDAGYETVGLSENPWVSEAFNLAQGFERFRLLGGFRLRADEPEPAAVEREVVGALDAWLAARRPDRPFFLFVNLLDAHNPYRVRDTNPFLPAGVDVRRARAVSQDLAGYLCRTEEHGAEVAVLRGLYLGGVAAADATLGVILDRVRSAGHGRDLVTIVTSDHGEHFGEHGLVGHQFSVREALLHVPLIVHGLRDVAPAVIDTPVTLAAVAPTILALAAAPALAASAGRGLPLRADTVAESPPIVAQYEDSEDAHDPDGAELAAMIRAGNRAARNGCSRDLPVYGAIRALIAYPWKLIAYADYPPELYDLRTDPGETRDRAADEPDRVAALAAALDRRLAGVTPAPPDAAGGSKVPLPPEVRERLRALGYLGAGGDPPP